MSSQIFKDEPPQKILFDFLEAVCVRTNNKYVFSKANFKKAQMENKIRNKNIEEIKKSRFLFFRNGSFSGFSEKT